MVHFPGAAYDVDLWKRPACSEPLSLQPVFPRLIGSIDARRAQGLIENLRPDKVQPDARNTNCRDVPVQQQIQDVKLCLHLAKELEHLGPLLADTHFDLVVSFDALDWFLKCRGLCSVLRALRHVVLDFTFTCQSCDSFETPSDHAFAVCEARVYQPYQRRRNRKPRQCVATGPSPAQPPLTSIRGTGKGNTTPHGQRSLQPRLQPW